jgi:hypothetical protein
MAYPREPRIHSVSITDLRPTQITVGMREVKAKRKSWREHPDRKKPDFLGKHMIPVIWGPKEEYYVIDHHHLTLALHQEGVRQIATTVVADLRRLPREAFWVYLDNRGWIHPFDEHGRRRGYDDVPKRIPGLIDDPYRSLAGELRQSGGYSKETTPFCEFLWADYLRRRLKRKLLENDFPAALVRALKLAKSSDADFLPGWCGPIA